MKKGLKKEEVVPVLGMQTLVLENAKDPAAINAAYGILGFFAVAGTVSLTVAATPFIAGATATAIVGTGLYWALGLDSSSSSAKSDRTIIPVEPYYVDTYKDAFEDFGKQSQSFPVQSSPVVRNDDVHIDTSAWAEKVAQSMMNKGFQDPRIRVAELKAKQQEVIVADFPIDAGNVLYKKEQKKLSKEKLEKKAAKEAKKSGGGSGGKKPEEPEKKERKVNPESFKQDLKKDPQIKENYEPQRNGSSRLKDHAKNPLKMPDGEPVTRIDWDGQHYDAEAYGGKDGNIHLGSIDPVTKQIYKAAVATRTFFGWAGIGAVIVGEEIQASGNASNQFENYNVTPTGEYARIEAPEHREAIDEWKSSTASYSDCKINDYIESSYMSEWKESVKEIKWGE